MLSKAPVSSTQYRAWTGIITKVTANMGQRVISPPVAPPIDTGANGGEAVHTRLVAVKVKSDKVFVDRIVYLLDAWMNILKGQHFYFLDVSF